MDLQEGICHCGTFELLNINSGQCVIIKQRGDDQHQKKTVERKDPGKN